jgi:DNA-binding transcriptional regulator YiaG
MSATARLCRELRIRAGFRTQEDLASYVGVTCRSVSRWENRHSQPPAGLAQHLAVLIANPHLRPHYERSHPAP